MLITEEFWRLEIQEFQRLQGISEILWAVETSWLTQPCPRRVGLGRISGERMEKPFLEHPLHVGLSRYLTDET